MPRKRIEVEDQASPSLEGGVLPELKGSATMRDVAALAGVSPIVVSRVLSNRAKSIRVSDATAKRVREAAARLDYRPNVLARNFRYRRTMMIGVLHGAGFPMPKFDQGSRYFAALVDGIVEGAFKHEYAVTLCPKLLGQTPEDAMADGRFDGLVWYSNAYTDENRRMIRECSVPLVIIHAHAADFDNRFPTVCCDNEGGVVLAVNHLAGQGHRSIGFLQSGSVPHPEGLARRSGFLAAMKALGLSADMGDVVPVGDDLQQLEEYLAHGPRHSAVVAENDALAAEVLARAPKFGLGIPRDLSVVGFDSTAYCEELRPRLTSVSQPLSAMGEGAIDLLVETIGNGRPERLEITYPCGLDVRESTTHLHRED